MADVACLGCSNPNDWLIFLDSDAFPIADLRSYLEKKLTMHPLVAVRRDENLGEPQPHPCFCATTVGFWKEIGGDWSRGYAWPTPLGPVTDIGANLLGNLRERTVDWFPMTRSNKVDLHPVLFGVYDNQIYHHGAGSRAPVMRVDLANNVGMDFSKISAKNSALCAEVEREILIDPQFYARFI